MHPTYSARTLWILVLLLPLLAPAAQSAEPQFYVCSATTQMRGTMYVTQPKPLGPDGDAMRLAWLDYVKKNYIPDAWRGSAQCQWGTRSAMTSFLESRKQQLRPTKVVDVDWSYWKGTDTAALNAASKTGQYVLCYSDVGQSPVYISGDIHIDVAAAPDPQSKQPDSAGGRAAVNAVKAQYLGFIKQHYGYKSSSAYPAECDGGKKSAADLASIRDVLHTRFKQDKFIETGWQPAH